MCAYSKLTEVDNIGSTLLDIVDFKVQAVGRGDDTLVSSLTSLLSIEVGTVKHQADLWHQQQYERQLKVNNLPSSAVGQHTLKTLSRENLTSTPVSEPVTLSTKAPAERMASTLKEDLGKL
jgi:hypothetical protein